MTKIEVLVDRLTELLRDSSLPNKTGATMCISYFVDDVLQLLNNINDTSLNNFDRLERIIQMERDFGISKTHMING